MKVREYLVNEMNKPQTEEFYLDEFNNIKQISRVRNGWVFFEGDYQGMEVPVDNLMKTGKYHKGITLWTYSDLVEYGDE